MAKNCYEVKNCERGPNGNNAELGVCPVFLAKDFDGTNHGKLGGRLCWYIAGTFCGGQVQGSFAQKKLSCLSCEFFKSVREEEGENFIVTLDIVAN